MDVNQGIGQIKIYRDQIGKCGLIEIAPFRNQIRQIRYDHAESIIGL